MTKRNATGKKAKARVHRMKGWAVWNMETGEFLGAAPDEDRAKGFWCITRGPTTFGPCTVTVLVTPIAAKGKRR